MRISLYYLIVPAFILGSCGTGTNSGSNVPADSTSADTINHAAMQTPAPSNTPGISDSITMTVTPVTFKAGKVGKAKLTITNNAAQEISFGDPYKVEFNNGGNWDKVTMFDSVMFTAMMHSIAPGNSQDFNIDLQPMPHDYQPGDYRILKGAQAGDQPVQLTATFSVGK